MCSGRIEPAFVMQALANGADGVMVVGCPPGDCHYNSGNFKTKRRMTLLRSMLTQMGVEPERIKLEWLSSAESDKFKQAVADFTKDVAKLGPLNFDKEVKKVAAAV
jgi:F420-non-reducing hydrogenase iron-sulfur subunit